MFQVLSAVGELERSIISERTRLKLQHLKSKGVVLGRPVKGDINRIYELRSKGLSLSQIGWELNIHKSTASKALKKKRFIEAD